MKSKLGIGILLLAAVFLIFLALNLIPVKYEIDRSVQGQKWEFDRPEICEEVTIAIQGEYVKYFLHFFHNDYFEGRIMLSGYDFTQSEDSFLYRVNFASRHYNMGTLAYGSSRGANFPVIGMIFQRTPLEEGVILLDESLERGENQQVISFPCQNRKEAAALADQLLPDGFVYQ